jgi:hypothetical protein
LIIRSDLVERGSVGVADLRGQDRVRPERRRRVADDPGEDEEDLQQGKFNILVAQLEVLFHVFGLKLQQISCNLILLLHRIILIL